MTLTRIFRNQLLYAVKMGGYNPDKCLCFVEEQMTLEECSTAQQFLRWCVNNQKSFGHGNIEQVFKEFLRSQTGGGA